MSVEYMGVGFLMTMQEALEPFAKSIPGTEHRADGVDRLLVRVLDGGGGVMNPKKPPRKKGIRNPVQQYAVHGTHGGPMRDRRDRRPKDQRRSWKVEVWS